MTLLTLIVFLGLISLGRWQLNRAAEKRVLFQEFAAGTDATTAIDASTPPLARFQHLEARGHYDTSRQVLIDIADDEHGAGYYVITPFLLTGSGVILVNRGWVPYGVSHRVLPHIEVKGDERRITGRADHMPAPGLRLQDRPTLTPPYPVVASYPTYAELQALLKEPGFSHASELVLLDRDQPDGYVRTWRAPGFPPERHIGYAVQWFGLAAALLVIYVVTNTNKNSGA